MIQLPFWTCISIILIFFQLFKNRLLFKYVRPPNLVFDFAHFGNHQSRDSSWDFFRIFQEFLPKYLHGFLHDFSSGFPPFIFIPSFLQEFPPRLSDKTFSDKLGSSFHTTSVHSVHVFLFIFVFISLRLFPK